MKNFLFVILLSLLPNSCLPARTPLKLSCITNHTAWEKMALDKFPSVTLDIDQRHRTVIVGVKNNSQKDIIIDDTIRVPGGPSTMGIKIRTQDVGTVVNPAPGGGRIINDGYISKALLQMVFSAELSTPPHFVTLHPGDSFSQTTKTADLVDGDWKIPADNLYQFSLKFRLTVLNQYQGNRMECETDWYNISQKGFFSP